MLVFLAILSLASAASIQDSRIQILPSSIQSVNGHQAPVSIIQLLRSPVQTVLSPKDTIQYIGQARYGLEHDRRQYSIISADPSIQNQYFIESIRPEDQQITILPVQPQVEQLSLGAIQPIDIEKRIILQPVDQGKQIVTLVESDLQKNPINNLRITSELLPLQYSSIIQPADHKSSVSVSAHSRPVSIEGHRDSGKGALQYSYFIRGSDSEHQGPVGQVVQPQVSVIKQHLEPPRYSSISVLQPRVSSVVVQPLKQVRVQEVVQPQQQQVGVVGYANVNSNHRVHSVQDSSN